MRHSSSEQDPFFQVFGLESQRQINQSGEFVLKNDQTPRSLHIGPLSPSYHIGDLPNEEYCYGD